MARYDSDNVKVFSLRDLVVFGLAFMAPTAPALVWGDAAAMSGGALASSAFFALLFMFFTVGSFRKLTTTFPPAGSIYTHADTGVRRYVGFITDWSLLLLFIFAPIAFIMTGAALAHAAIDALPYFAWVFILSVAAGLINIFGTRILAMSNTAFVIITMSISIIFMLVCAMSAAKGTGAGSFFSGEPIQGGLGGILAGGGAASVALIGFTVISGMSGESESPKKNIGKAMLISAVSLGVFFLIQAYTAGLIWPDVANKIDFATDNAAIEVARQAGGSAMVFLFGLATVLSSVAVAAAGIAAASRKLYAMGRKNVLPKRFFTNVNRTTRIPALNVILIFVLIFLLSLLFKTPAIPMEIFKFGGAFVSILVNLTVLIHFYFRRNGEGLASCLIFPALGLFAGLYMWINTSLTFLFGLLWLALGLALVAAVDFGIGGAFERVSGAFSGLSGKLPKRAPAQRTEKPEPRRPRLRNHYPEDDARDEEGPGGSVIDRYPPQREREPRDEIAFGYSDQDEPEPDIFAELERQSFDAVTPAAGREEPNMEEMVNAPIIEEVNVNAPVEDFGEPEADVFSNFKKREVFTLDDIEGLEGADAAVFGEEATSVPGRIDDARMPARERREAAPPARTPERSGRSAQSAAVGRRGAAGAPPLPEEEPLRMEPTEAAEERPRPETRATRASRAERVAADPVFEREENRDELNALPSPQRKKKQPSGADASAAAQRAKRSPSSVAPRPASDEDGFSGEESGPVRRRPAGRVARKNTDQEVAAVAEPNRETNLRESMRESVREPILESVQEPLPEIPTEPVRASRAARRAVSAPAPQDMTSPAPARSKANYTEDEADEQDSFPLQWFVPGEEEAPAPSPGRQERSPERTPPQRRPSGERPVPSRQSAERPAPRRSARAAAQDPSAAPATPREQAPLRGQVRRQQPDAGSVARDRERVVSQEPERIPAGRMPDGRAPSPRPARPAGTAAPPSGGGRSRSYTELFVHTAPPAAKENTSGDLLNQWNIPASDDMDEKDYFED